MIDCFRKGKTNGLGELRFWKFSQINGWLSHTQNEWVMEGIHPAYLDVDPSVMSTSQNKQKTCPMIMQDYVSEEGCLADENGGFLEWGYSQINSFNLNLGCSIINHPFWSILVIPHFWKPPCCHFMWSADVPCVFPASAHCRVRPGQLPCGGCIKSMGQMSPCAAGGLRHGGFIKYGYPKPLVFLLVFLLVIANFGWF